MKNHLLISALCLAVCSTTAFAADSEGVYLGVKAGRLMLDLSSTGFETEDPNTFSITGGYQFANGFSAELEYIPQTEADFGINGVRLGTVEVQTVGVYAAYRIKPSTGSAYFKLRGGLLNENVDAAVGGAAGSYSTSDSGLSFGLGAGFNLTQNVMLEAEYTIIEQDVDFLSAGLNFKF